MLSSRRAKIVDLESLVPHREGSSRVLTRSPSDLFELVKKKLANGEDVRPHLSNRYTDPNYSDSLLNDWKIHHQHLGTTMEAG